MRLLIVSNRLPTTVVGGSGLRFQESVGGLVSGLKSYLESLKNSPSYNPICKYVWIGWPGITINDQIKEMVKSKLFSEFNSYPIFLSDSTMDKFYNGFCNKTIWPLFHYFTSNVAYDENNWIYYKKVNRSICDVVMQILRPDDIVWIHDYHLMLLPKLIKDRVPSVPIGFFLHIPFPSFEVFRLLPSNWRKEILEGLLGADLIGFHTQDYTQYFLRCVLRILGYEHSTGQIIANNHLVKADTFPMGIDFQKYFDAANCPEVQKEKDELKRIFAEGKVILSIDRLDYTKGIISRLQGFETFLENNPQWQGKASLVIIVVPSRTKVDHYQQMRKQIEELVSRINGRFGSFNWIPILYHYKFIPFPKLIALYSISNVALITPLRDGMNLIAKEYLASKTDGKGVLIISEMAGASKEVREALIINPNDINEIAISLKDALEMPEDEQVRRNQIMQYRLKHHNIYRWANDFIQALLSIKEKERSLEYGSLVSSSKGQLMEDFTKSERRLLLLDYDGTLVQYEKLPQTAKPTESILGILRLLSDNPKNKVVLLSGRDKFTLQNWFGSLNIDLVAEHGAWIRKTNEDWRILKPLTNDWKSKILPILETYADRLPGSFIEDKDFSLAWH
ncbi:MAG: bifunctional alpha,alpha-trehalose-phosphate synthase (UDP-forming)/trehalose-phosphatase, partial [Methanotrichaceae archaeon]|nr:bifunctional alpha,alpha-trehalose-phosphate synthase (UDP-forming)/trehalose-phosphatase [Methanotrichaceae archaeon]